MNLFKRKQDLSNQAPDMPPELNQYYQAEKRQQTAVTWLLGLATLAITVAVAFLIFMAARWVVHKVRNNPALAPESAQQDSPEENEGATVSNGETTTQQNTPNTATNSTAGQTASGSATKPQTSSATTSLPNTGPTETLAVFFIATAIGTFAYKRSVRQ